MIKGDRHGPNSFQNYAIIAEERLAQFGDFILSNSLTYTVTEREIYHRGRLDCQCGTYLEVDKTLAKPPDGRIQTRKYKYQACVVAGLEANGDPITHEIFRYDNVHAHLGHPDEHHKHCFDPISGASLGPPEWMGREGWPLMHETIQELQDWCAQYGICD